MTLPWMVLSFLLFFVGMFVLVFFSLRSQDRALESINQQQALVRMELERLADSLDALLKSHEVEDRDLNPASIVPSSVSSSAPAQNTGTSALARQNESNGANSQKSEAVPGIQRLLLGPDKNMDKDFGKKLGTSSLSKLSSEPPRSSGLPDLKF